MLTRLMDALSRAGRHNCRFLENHQRAGLRMEHKSRRERRLCFGTTADSYKCRKHAFLSQTAQTTRTARVWVEKWKFNESKAGSYSNIITSCLSHYYFGLWIIHKLGFGPAGRGEEIIDSKWVFTSRKRDLCLCIGRSEKERPPVLWRNKFLLANEGWEILKQCSQENKFGVVGRDA